MGSRLKIDKIQAVSDLAISNSSGKVNQPRLQFEAWSTTNNTADGPQGSLAPVALQIPNTATASYQLPFVVTGKCTFPSNYPRVAICKLVGTLQGGPNVPILESEQWPITLTPGNPPPEETKDFKFSNFSTAAPFKDGVCPVPMRWAGDFEWKLISAQGLPLPGA
jgi:hypothetical protein